LKCAGAPGPIAKTGAGAAIKSASVLETSSLDPTIDA
jgi:hypothetical protein